VSRSKKQSPASEHGDKLFLGATNVSQQGWQDADQPQLISDDTDLLREGATIFQQQRQLASDRAARLALEEQYHQAYRPLEMEISFMQGSRDNAKFRGQVYDCAAHFYRLAELLVNYFQILRKTEPILSLRSIDEGAVLQQDKANGNPRLAKICLTYSLRLFRAGLAGASREQLERKLAEVAENPQMVGVWRWIIWLGCELGPDRWPQEVANRGSRTGSKSEASKPAWDKLNRVLTYGGRRLRRYQASAQAQIAILDTFQELNWDNVVDSPFPATKNGRDQLKNAIKNLNMGLEPQGVIGFYGDGTGTHVCWRRL
jgi:hypothetical protein